MHMKPAVLVFAEDEEEAISKAKGIFEGLCENERPFDYYEIFEIDKGVGNWKQGEKAYVQGTPEFEEIVKTRMDYTKNEFMRNIKEVRKALKAKTDEQLYAARFGDVKVRGKMVMFRYC
jgi:hypothetical protein